ncbi:MAG TPA: type II toxin-antitoxin system ParD family antitoxin [Acidobacteriaceae bacterium]|nr:type II toxin-antitoxin system ParD family antitoxin [Acidobacteriaceae bacterium]
MPSLNVSLPDRLQQYLEQQIASGDWSTPGEYIRELIRQDKERRLAALEDELLEGISSAKVELSVEDVEKHGLVASLRKKVRSR